MFRLFGLFLLVAWLGVVFPLHAIEDDFVPIFNGKDLSGWKVDGGRSDVWGAADGVLFVEGSRGGWLLTEKDYADFELRFEYKMPKLGNSGVALRAPLGADPAYAGMEIQLLDDKTWVERYPALKPVQLTGAIYDVVAPSKDATKPAGEWSTMRIVAQGRKVLVELNGMVIVDANLDDHKDRVKEDTEKKLRAHPGLERMTGRLGFQSHDGRVEFKNVRVKELK